MTKLSNIVKAQDQIIGVKVINNVDEDLGKIHEIMLNKQKGQVVYVVLESSKFLGMGSKLFAVPWHALHFDDKKDCFRINIDKDHLKKAPGFDKEKWPDMADKTWGDTISSYYHIDEDQ